MTVNFIFIAIINPGEFDSGLDHRGVEGKNIVLSVFFCIRAQ